MLQNHPMLNIHLSARIITRIPLFVLKPWKLLMYFLHLDIFWGVRPPGLWRGMSWSERRGGDPPWYWHPDIATRHRKVRTLLFCNNQFCDSITEYAISHKRKRSDNHEIQCLSRLVLIEPKMDLDESEPVMDPDRDGGDDWHDAPDTLAADEALDALLLGLPEAPGSSVLHICLLTLLMTTKESYMLTHK